jgi:hypothetical protein
MVMELTNNVKLIFIIASFIELFFSLFFIPRVIFIIRSNKMPYQLEWLSQSLICFVTIQAYNLLTCLGIIKMRPEYYDVLHWLVYISFMYFMLFTTKYGTNHIEKAMRLFILVSHLIFGLVTMFIVMDIFVNRMGPNYSLQSHNLYSFIYSLKNYTFLFEFTSALILNVFSMKRLPYKKTVLWTKFILQISLGLFLMSYYVVGLFPMFFLTYELAITICIILTMTNVFKEKGRFLND